MANDVLLAYDKDARTATLTFSKGRQLKITNISEEKAKAFRDKHAAEFEKRDLCLSSIDGMVTREGDNG